ncbi:MAG TPA: c-type cytochrome [Beijerinckiaceae bacterium]|jgi:cytochrome c
MRWPFLLLALLASVPAEAQLRGHGGPVRALATSPQGAISGSFDQSAIIWSVEEGAARQVLRLHEGAVNAVAALGQDRYATAGEDGRVALWRAGNAAPVRVVAAHRGPIVALAVSNDGRRLASASWDGTAGIVPVEGGEVLRLEGHQGNVNAVAFLPDGTLATAGYDATLRLWRADGTPQRTITLPTALNALVAAPDGALLAAGADGVVREIAPDGSVRALDGGEGGPVLAMAIAPDGARIAAAGLRRVQVLDRRTGRTALALSGPVLPVWSIAYRPDGSEILTGGGDRVVRRWDARTGEPVGALAVAAARPEAATAGDRRGAEVFRACAACHALTPDEGNRAGPSLVGLFGRRIATGPNYAYSEALRRMDITWTPQTVSELFEVGPSRYTPGTKMPEQVIADPEDRAALMRYLAEATTPR